MVYAAICWKGKKHLVFVVNQRHTPIYVQMQQAHLEPFMEEHYPSGSVFQQGGAPAQAAKFYPGLFRRGRDYEHELGTELP